MSFTTTNPSPMNNHKQCNKLKQKIKQLQKESNWRNLEECTCGSSRKWVACSSHLFLMMQCFMTSHLFGLTLVSFVQNSTTTSTTSFVSTSLLFAWTIGPHYMLVLSSSCILLLCPLFKILQFVSMSWPIVVRLWVELETTILLTIFLALISSRLWPTFIPCQPSLMLSTIQM